MRKVLVLVAFLVALPVAACGSRTEPGKVAVPKTGGVTTTDASPTSVTLPTVIPPPDANAPTTEVIDRLGYLCDAATVYSLDDLNILAQHLVEDPDNVLYVFEFMKVYIPPENLELVVALEPLTREAVDNVKNGQIARPEDLQTWIANTASQESVQAWIAAQQQLVPILKTLCSEPL